jgi:amino acid transporter
MADYEKNEMTARTLSPAGETVFKTGNLEYVAEQGENGGKTTYQEASGAPVEAHSPLPARVQWFTIIFLNIGQMIGTGVFSTRTSCRTLAVEFSANTHVAGSILIGTGSVGLSLMYWIIGFVVSLAGLAVYLELGSYFPSRSGAEVVYLEQAYPRPRYFFPVAFAVQPVILSFSSSNAIGKLSSFIVLHDMTN